MDSADVLQSFVAFLFHERRVAYAIEDAWDEARARLAASINPPCCFYRDGQPFGRVAAAQVWICWRDGGFSAEFFGRVDLNQRLLLGRFARPAPTRVMMSLLYLFGAIITTCGLVRLAYDVREGAALTLCGVGVLASVFGFVRLTDLRVSRFVTHLDHLIRSALVPASAGSGETSTSICLEPPLSDY